MKVLKIFIVINLLAVFFGWQVMAQTKGGFGAKAGLNYNSNGQYFKEAKMAFGDPLDNMGFHAGFFGKLKLGPFFVRPELMYSQMKTELDGASNLTQRLDAPILAGIGLLGSLVTVFAGPSFHYTLRDDLSDYRINGHNRFNSGYQIGAGLNLGRIGLDLRYERELIGEEVNLERVMSNDGGFRFQQLILGLSYRF